MIQFAEFKNLVQRLIYRLLSLAVYMTMLDIKVANVVGDLGML
jgi:hypothetical protein